MLRASKPIDRQGKVLVINGETLMRKGRNQNTLEPEHATQLLALYQGFSNVEGLAGVASLQDIKENSYSLNIPLYVAPPPDLNALTLEQALANLRVAHEAAAVSRAQLNEQLLKWGLV